MTASTALTAGPFSDIVALGQSVWFDNIRRGLFTSGELDRMVREDGLSGMTSNPSIFEKAIVGSTDYDEALAELRGAAALRAPDRASTRGWRSPTCATRPTSCGRSTRRPTAATAT